MVRNPFPGSHLPLVDAATGVSLRQSTEIQFKRLWVLRLLIHLTDDWQHPGGADILCCAILCDEHSQHVNLSATAY